MTDKLEMLREVPEELYQSYEIVRESGVWNMASLIMGGATIEPDFKNLVKTLKEIYIYLCLQTTKGENTLMVHPFSLDKVVLLMSLYDVAKEEYTKTTEDIKIIPQPKTKLIIN